MQAPRQISQTEQCPCSSGRHYGKCCGPMHAGSAAPQVTPEALMRSRYSAYVLQLPDYLLASWHPNTRPGAPMADKMTVRWLGLKVLDASASDDGESGIVEFIARYRDSGAAGGKAGRLHERSRFVRIAGAWLYLDGDITPAR